MSTKKFWAVVLAVVAMVSMLCMPVAADSANITDTAITATTAFKAYRHDEWDGSFSVTDDHCYSINPDGELWFDSKGTGFYPDLQSGKRQVEASLFRTSAGLYVYNVKSKTFQLWKTGKLVAESDYAATFSRFYSLPEASLFVAQNGLTYTLKCEGKKIVPVEIPVSVDWNDTEKTLPWNILHEAHLFYSDGWNGEQRQLASGEFISYEKKMNFSSGNDWFTLVVNNETFENVSLEVDPYCSQRFGNWGLFDGYAIEYRFGKMRRILPLPSDGVTLVTANIAGVTVLDEEGNLWWCDENGNIEVATDVVEAMAHPEKDMCVYLNVHAEVHFFCCPETEGWKIADNATAILRNGPFLEVATSDGEYDFWGIVTERCYCTWCDHHVELSVVEELPISSTPST